MIKMTYFFNLFLGVDFGEDALRFSLDVFFCFPVFEKLWLDNSPSNKLSGMVDGIAMNGLFCIFITMDIPK